MTDQTVEHVRVGDCLLAIIVRSEVSGEGVQFFTPNQLSQQLAYMHHPAGKKIAAHIHNFVSREVTQTQEVLVIRSGILRVDFYDKQKEYVESRVVSKGDVILLVQGGHGFEVLEEVEMFEIKQGPYIGDEDKTRFEGISADQVKIRRK